MCVCIKLNDTSSVHRSCVCMRMLGWFISICYMEHARIHSIVCCSISEAQTMQYAYASRVCVHSTVNYDFRVYSCMIILFSFRFSTLSSLRDRCDRTFTIIHLISFRMSLLSKLFSASLVVKKFIMNA